MPTIYLYAKEDGVEEFDPNHYEPHGIICMGCDAPLTRDNVLNVDVTHEYSNRLPDGVKIVQLQCIDCTINNIDT
jgi:hypothetical protein